MKSMMVLLCALIDEPSVRCSTAHRERDKRTVATRVKHEGMSFLTITLPRFGADFDTALSLGQTPSSSYPAFKRRKRGECLPGFLQGFTRQVFDDNGVVLDNPSIEAIHIVRQITRLFKKIELPCTPERESAALAKFVQVDEDLAGLEFSDHMVSLVSRLSWHFSEVITPISQKIENMEILPNHGPGAVSIPQRSNAKWNMDTWDVRLEETFPLTQYAHSSVNAWLERGEEINIHEPDDGSKATLGRVVTVNKDQEKPRVITIEPVHRQFVQQGIKDELYGNIERHPVLGGQINFTDQTINQNLALESSKTGRSATLDLSEASDRNSLRLMEICLAKFPVFWEAVMACRTSKVSVPGEGVITLNKFASMGSALCFPMEAIAFFTIACAAIIDTKGLSPTAPTLQKLRRRCLSTETILLSL